MTRPLRYFTVWRALGWLLVVLVVYLSLTPAPPNIPVTGGDKLGHVLAYGMLMAWFAWLYADLGIRTGFAIGFVVLGVSLEFAQGLTEYRSFELGDMAADCVGVALGWIAAYPPVPNVLAWIEGCVAYARRTGR